MTGKAEVAPEMTLCTIGRPSDRSISPGSLFVSGDQLPSAGEYDFSMEWWTIPLFVLVAVWALYLYSTPSAKVKEHIAKIREWWKSRRT
jgi:hypothetical protein